MYAIYDFTLTINKSSTFSGFLGWGYDFLKLNLHNDNNDNVTITIMELKNFYILPPIRYS